MILGDTVLTAQTVGGRGTSLLDEPGTINVEQLLPQPVKLKVAHEAIIYYNADFQRALGNMAPGTVVTLIALSDAGYRVRGRARHADVSGWMRPGDLVSSDPDLQANLKKVYERHVKVRELIASKQVAVGMTRSEVEESMGRPTRSSSKVSADGREDMMEYSVFERVPQAVTGRDETGQLVQSIIYVRVETGTLTVQLKDDVVESIEEKVGNPLGTGGVKIVVPPILFR